jgi:hypothetical protein
MQGACLTSQPKQPEQPARKQGLSLQGPAKWCVIRLRNSGIPRSSEPVESHHGALSRLEEQTQCRLLDAATIPWRLPQARLRVLWGGAAGAPRMNSGPGCSAGLRSGRPSGPQFIPRRSMTGCFLPPSPVPTPGQGWGPPLRIQISHSLFSVRNERTKNDPARLQ